MRISDSNGGTNHIVPFSNGALRPPDVDQIGPAFPLFLALEDMVTTGEGRMGLSGAGNRYLTRSLPTDWVSTEKR